MKIDSFFRLRKVYYPQQAWSGWFMKKIFLIVFILPVVIFSGCGPASYDELRTKPAIHDNLVVAIDYQYALKIFKESYGEKVGQDISCTVYNNQNIGECNFSWDHGVAFLATFEAIPDGGTQVDFYAGFASSGWRSNIKFFKQRLLEAR